MALAGFACLVAAIAGSVAQAQTMAPSPSLQAISASMRTIYEWDWQRGVDPRMGVQANPGDISVIDDPVRHGHKVMRATIDRGENFSHIANGVARAEVLFPAPVRFAQGGDYLIEWSTYLAPNFAFDSKQLMIITQIHQGSRKGGPAVALTLLGTRYAISEHGGAEHKNVSAAQWLCCADTDRGKWVRWALHYVPDETGKHAVAELYKNDALVFTATHAANAYPDAQDAYFKLGLYKPDWYLQPTDVSSSTVLYGAVRISQR
ncbi:heparin lyase I family protein [Paraburkholderia sp.]|uniref:heparin lyase I family protein n=1 Tax=Paraburkholderia sp. TaxID=1926495 RepID=UPI003D6ED36F